VSLAYGWLNGQSLQLSFEPGQLGEPHGSRLAFLLLIRRLATIVRLWGRCDANHVSHVEFVYPKIPKSTRLQNGGAMRYLLLVLTTLFAFDVSSARADPIPIFHVTAATMAMRPNVSGDNISFEFTGPGVDIRGTGGMGCFAWCSGAPIPLGTSTRLTPISIANFDRAIVGGVIYAPRLPSRCRRSSTIRAV
jgi:hypothetical protein